MVRDQPQADLRSLIEHSGLTTTALERRAGMARGSLQRVVVGRRGRATRLTTASKLANVLGVSLEEIAAALDRTQAENEEKARRLRETERAILEAELA